MIKNLYLYRHGETNWNLLSLVMGQLENIKTTFTSNGMNQIENISKQLKENSIEIIYCSDFSRAYGTALLASKTEIPIIKTEQLRGLNMGTHQGELFNKYITSPDVIDALRDYTIPIGGGESINDLNKRIERFILELCYKSCYNNIGIITHSAVISNFKSYLTKEQYCSLKRCQLEYCNGNLKVVDYAKNEKSEIKLNNEYIFLRHGENVYIENIPNDDLTLSDLGIFQAEAIRKKLKMNFDIVVSSPAQRCLKTAKIVSHSKHIIMDERLYERGWGNGKNGDESILEAKERFLDFLLNINETYTNKKILIVTHGSLMRLIQDVIEQNCVIRERISNCDVIQYNKTKKKTILTL